MHKEYFFNKRILFYLCSVDTSKYCSGPLKGLCHEMNIFLKAYTNKQILSAHALVFFKFFLFLS